MTDMVSGPSARSQVKDPLPEPLQRFDAASPAALLLEVDELRLRYQAKRTANQILPNAIEAIRIELTYHSNAIEGNTLSLRDTQLVIEGLEPNSGKSLREIYEARNHDRALRKIESWLVTNPLPAPVTVQDLLDVHAEVLADIDPNGAGRFRTDRVLITGTRYIPPGSHKFTTLMPAVMNAVHEAESHSAVKAAEFHYNLVAVHPFGDGNGRTARLMMNYHLLRNGFPHVIIPVEERSKYLSTLEEANAGRCEPFATFILTCIKNSILKLIDE